MKIKKKTYLTFSIITVVFIILTACSNNFTEVRIKVSDIKVIDFNKYDKIVYADLAIESPPKGFTPVNELNLFFLEDFAKIIGKDIQHFEVKEEPGKKREDIIAEAYKDSPNTLLITGKVTFEIKTRSKIREVKNKEGKKEKKFVPVQHWTLKVKIEIIEAGKGEALFKKTYSEKTAEPDISDPKYNFDDLFFEINNRFQKDITNIKRTQRRYLLLN